MVVNRRQSYRLIPGTASDGLMLRGGAPIAASGAFEQIPQAKTIELRGKRNLRFSFFGMRVGSGRSSSRRSPTNSAGFR